MITLKNITIEKLFTTLFKVDKASIDLDFSIKFKNKKNFKLLKEAYTSLNDTANDIFEKYGEKVSENGKEMWQFGDKKELVDTEIKKLYDIEVELDITPITIVARHNSELGKTDTMGLVITSNEMETLEPIFEFNFVQV